MFANKTEAEILESKKSFKTLTIISYYYIC